MDARGPRYRVGRPHRGAGHRAASTVHLAQCNRMPEAFALFASLEAKRAQLRRRVQRVAPSRSTTTSRALAADLSAAVPAARRLGLLNFAAIALTLLTRAEYAAGRWDQALAAADRAVALGGGSRVPDWCPSSGAFPSPWRRAVAIGSEPTATPRPPR